MKHNMIYFDESSYLPDEVFEGLSAMLPDSHVATYIPKRKSWFKRHELAIWLVIVALLSILLVWFISNEDVLWQATTPVVNFIGGSNVQNIN